MKWEEPLFNLYREVKGYKVTLPNDKPCDITAQNYNQYGSELQTHINVLDAKLFTSKIEKADDISVFMYDVAANTNWGGTERWLRNVHLILSSLLGGTKPEKMRDTYEWISMMQESWASLDNYGMAIMTHILFKDDLNMGYGKKIKYIKSIKVTDAAPDSFYKLYLEVEKQYQRPEKDWIPQFKKALKNVLPIIVLMQKKMKNA